MKTATYPSSFLIQMVEGFNCFGGGRLDKLYILFGQELPERVCNAHITGLPLTDDKYLRFVVEKILHILDFNRVTAFAPPIRHQGALDNFDVMVAGLTVDNNPAE